MQDCHIHSRYSADAEQTIETICETAVSRGLTEIAITDHIDIDYPYEMDFSFDIPARAGEIDAARKRYPQLAIRNGVEIGLMPENKKDYVNIVQSHPFDFVIASIHVVDGVDPFDRETYFRGKTRDQAYRRYLEAIEDGMRNFDDYDVLGHIGYVSRFFPGEEKVMRDGEYADIIDRILITLIENGKGLEVNTKGLLETGDTLPPQPILERYHQLGGKVITLGSDAHVPERIGEHIRETMERLKRIGFTHYTSYSGRKPTAVKL